MRKLIILAASIAALAVPAVSIAAVTYDDTSVGTVGKGDVQSLFGWNDAALQNAWKAGKITFTSKYVLSSEQRWSCSDGTTQSRTSNVTQSRLLNVTAVTNPHGKVTGFTLNGIDQSKPGDFLGGGYTGAPYVGSCGAGWSTGFLPTVFTNTVVPGVYVNGVELPVTPAV
jgi:hypothetical protein